MTTSSRSSASSRTAKTALAAPVLPTSSGTIARADLLRRERAGEHCRDPLQALGPLARGALAVARAQQLALVRLRSVASNTVVRISSGSPVRVALERRS